MTTASPLPQSTTIPTLRDPPSRRTRPTSPSSTTSSSSASYRRSRSPIITFSPAPLSADKGVQDITRKVIRRLEGLGHLEMVDMYAIPNEDEITEGEVESSNVSDGEVEREGEDVERAEVEKALYDELVRTRDKVNGFARANGYSNGQVEKKKVDLEIPRKVLHSSIGFLTLYLYVSEMDVSRVVLCLWSSLCIIVPADIVRFRSRSFEKLYERVLGFLMRETEKNSTNGVIWYILGVNFALQFYPRDVATVAILILSWADTAASTIGRLYGPSSRRLPSRLPILGIPLAPRKSVAGFIAASLTGALIAIGFWTWIAPMRFGGRDLSWTWDSGIVLGGASISGWLKGGLGLGILSIVAGLVSGVAEAMDLGSLDDNLTLPIVSGGCILGFLKLFGWIGSLWTSSP